MKKLLRSIIGMGLSLLLLSWAFPGIAVSNGVTVVLAAIVLAVLSLTVQPLLKVLFLPVNILTLGIFGWVINVFILWLATALVPGFQIGQLVIMGVTFGPFWSFVIVSLAITTLNNWLVNLL